MALSSNDTNTDATTTAGETQDSTSSFTEVAADWAALSSGDTITGELLNFVAALAKMAKSLGDVLSVANKYM